MLPYHQRRSRLMGLPVALASVALATIVLTIVMLSSTPGIAQASGGDITVSGDRWSIQFPGLVAFDFAAQSSQEIVEVQLRYRTVESRIWSYAYPNFEPARQITARFNLKVDGAGFVPPGTQIEYYYVIRDVQGNVHQTPSTVLEYTDTRFAWEQTRVGPLVLMHHDIPRSRVAAVTEGVDEQLKRLAELLQVDAARPIKGIIYNQRSAAIGAFPHQSRTITEQHVFEGFAFPERGVFVGLGLSPRLIVHESAHVLLHRTMGAAASRLPAWLDEGFASYMEPDSDPYSGESLSSLALPLESMSKVHGTPKDIGNFYVKSESVVAYLIEEHGIERFRRFLGQLRQGQPVSESLVSTYAFDLAGLEDLWAVDTRGRPASGGTSGARPSLFIYFDVWVMGLLVLVVMSALLIRYGVNKLRPSLKPEEGLQPWEDPDVLERQEDRGDPS